jgi:hypothetical protein
MILQLIPQVWALEAFLIIKHLKMSKAKDTKEAKETLHPLIQGNNHHKQLNNSNRFLNNIETTNQLCQSTSALIAAFSLL